MGPKSACRYETLLLLGFGGPESAADVRPFLDRVLAGRHIPPERYEGVVANYARIGGSSPYNELTRRLAGAVAAVLRERGIETGVEVAYRNAEPSLDEVLARLVRDGTTRALAVPLSPHGGVHGWDRYARECGEAVQRAGATLHVDYVEPFYDDPLFVQAHAERIAEATASFSGDDDPIELIFTAHSIPQADAEPYATQVARSAELIAQAAGAARWSVAYQSRSGSPREPWLGPDVRDALRALPERGVRSAVVAPIGFLCDHVEVLYDLDVDAREAAREAGVRMERAGALNDHPLFVRMLAERV